LNLNYNYTSNFENNFFRNKKIQLFGLACEFWATRAIAIILKWFLLYTNIINLSISEDFRMIGRFIKKL
jgi:hypothetical protein